MCGYLFHCVTLLISYLDTFVLLDSFICVMSVHLLNFGNGSRITLRMKKKSNCQVDHVHRNRKHQSMTTRSIYRVYSYRAILEPLASCVVCYSLNKSSKELCCLVSQFPLHVTLKRSSKNMMKKCEMEDMESMYIYLRLRSCN